MYGERVPSSGAQVPSSFPIDVNVDQAISTYRPRSKVRKAAQRAILKLLAQEGRFTAAELLRELRSELAREGLSVAPARLRSNIYSMLRYLLSKGLLRKVGRYYVVAVTKDSQLPEPLPPKVRTTGLKVAELRKLLYELLGISPSRRALLRWLKESGWVKHGNTSGAVWFPSSPSSIDRLWLKLKEYYENKRKELPVGVREYLRSFYRRWIPYPAALLPKSVAQELYDALKRENIDRLEVVVEVSSRTASWLRKVGVKVLHSVGGSSLVLLPYPFFWYRSARLTLLIEEMMPGATDTPAPGCASQVREQRAKVMGPLYDNVRTVHNEHLDEIVIAPNLSITYQVSLTKGGMLEELRKGNKIANAEVGWILKLPEQMPSVFKDVKEVKLYFPDSSNNAKIEIVMRNGEIKDRKDLEDREAVALALLYYISRMLSAVPAKSIVPLKEALRLLPYEESDTRTR